MNREKFWSKVNISSDKNKCWNWMGSKDRYGYGKFNDDAPGYKLIGAHRVAFMLAVGNIPDGMCICHKCDNPLCCNPDHLFCGTKKQNSLDMIKKGRGNYSRGESRSDSKLKDDDIRSIRRLRIQGKTTTEISFIFEISQSYVSHICNRRVWKHVK